MNFKNLSIILALLTFELKVFTLPVNDVVPEKELSSIDSEISTEELSPLEISESEVVVDELTVVEVVESSFEDSENDSETEVPTDSVSNDFSCDSIDDCIEMMKKKESKDILNRNNLNDFTKEEVLEYFRSQYKDEKNVKKLQQNFEAVDYGTKVDVDGHKMSVNIKGEEHNTTIVVLPGLGLHSPVLFYKSLTEILANDYKVVTIEPFGYGVSDLTDKERTAENIATEIHECLQELGINQFYLMAHSIGGIYSIVYDNIFKKEVLGFIGLDNTPSNYEDFKGPSYPNELIPFLKIFDKYHFWGLVPDDQKMALFELERELPYQNYTKEELEILININSYRYVNPNNIDETNLSKDNVNSTKDLYFHCPLLLFTSNQTESAISEWYTLHENMINNNPNTDVIDKSNLISLKNTEHGFIHTQEKERISEEIKKWIN